MSVNFAQMKPILQQDFDDILEGGPADLSALRNRIPTGGDAYERKRFLLEKASEECPVRLFRHYPFAFSIDVGERRDVGYVGIGNMCYTKSGADFSPLSALRTQMDSLNLGRFNDFTDHLHRTLDHDRLLTEGFRGVYEECASLNRAETDPQKKRYRELMMTACTAVRTIGQRLRNLARKQLETETDEDVRQNLRRIAESANTPWEPAETMFDALNSILATCLFISGLDGVEMNCYGAIDRLIDPYYRKDLAEGRITREEAYYLLQCFLHKTDLHAHFNEERKTYDNGVSVMIGGCDLQGSPVYNEITDMVIDAYRENRLINPKLNARAGASSPREYLQRLAQLIQCGNNNIVIENDDYIIPMFRRMGLSEEDARTYAGNGCQEVICRNHLHSRAFVYINLVQVMLDTLLLGEGGEALSENHRKIYGNIALRRETFEELYASFLQNLRSLIAVIAETFAPFERIQPEINPEPMLSAFTADCAAKGQDISEGGARYNHKTLSLVGFGTLCDSLLSLRRAYGEGKTEQLRDAVRTNFQDCGKLCRQLLESDDRFGHSAEADEFARRLSVDLASVSRGIVNGRGIQWGTSLFTYYLFHSLGQRTAATPDGRRNGESFSRQMNMAVLPSLTDAARSMAVLTEAEFQDVGMFDFALPYTVSEPERMNGVLTDYIRTCLEMKIPVLQINTADRETMLEEYHCKGTHPELVVRVCGYSAIFGQLSESMQREIISRTDS